MNRLRKILNFFSFRIDLRFRGYHAGASWMDYDPKTLEVTKFRIYATWLSRDIFRTWSFRR